MKRNLHYLIALTCVGMLGFAMYLQHFSGIKACQLCVLQRYVIALIAIVCFVCAFFKAARTGAGCGLLLSLFGVGAAGWQIWHASKPIASCGIDSLEDLLNRLITAKWLPALFRVDGPCVDDQYRLFSLSIPQWSLMAFCGFSVVFALMLFTRGRR